ncbi:hypothetical protein AcW1_002091 [Taiwanofungus camphoratus]|nr:hypothetical protein AcV5_010088 [Antrodia cinnamomea]KAI0944357.1 hypothetical protein AcW1_002091 [Antrodia cinnamomea]KAI0946001.1 hypothetical protein AcV7_010096 [Antrodia cinnamomea]
MASYALGFTSISKASPTEFLRVQPFVLPGVGPTEVKLKFLAAPINVQDLLVLAGKYPVKPATKYGDALIAGYEGVALVTEAGQSVTSLQVGDYVLPKEHGFGTWRTHAVVDAEKLVRIPAPANPIFASLLKMGYTPAYLLLRNMRYLKPGDWVIQNAATGTIAQALIQFARLQGVRTISVVRDRDDLDAVKSRLASIGADVVLSESEMAVLAQPLSSTRRIVLAIDSVFGASGTRIVNQLVQGGTYVSLGFLGGGGETKLDVTEGILFYKAVELKGFRTSKELAGWSNADRSDLWSWMLDLYDRGQLKAPAVDITEWPREGEEAQKLVEKLTAAVERTGSKAVGVPKQVFVFKD